MTNIIIGNGQTGDGIVVGGASYAIATDWGSAGGTGFTLTHAQIIKMAWGDNYNTYRTTKLKPLPVQIFDGSQGTTGALIDGDNNALKITGGVHINQALEIHGGKLDGNLTPVVGGIIQIVGPTFGKSGPTAYGPGHTRDYHFNSIKVTGSVQGFSAAYPLSITYGGGQPGKGLGEGLIRRLYGGPIGYTGYTGQNLITKPGPGQNSTILDRDIDTIAVQGISGAFAVGVSASTDAGFNTRNLRYDRDAVGIHGVTGAKAIEVTGGIRIAHSPAGGSMEIRNLSSGRDNVAIWGADGTTGAHVKIFDSAGNPLGVSGNGALKVAIDNGVFTGTVTLSTNVYVRNATGGVLSIKGTTGDIVVVQGPLSGGAIEVASPTGLNIRNLTSSDVVGLGGGASEDLGQIQSDVSVSSGRLSGIQTNTKELINYVKNIGNSVNNFELDGTSPSNVDSEKIVFNTTVHRIYQPEELISLTKIVGTNPLQLNSNTVVYNGVYVSAHPDNTESVMCGNQSLTRNMNAGYNLAAGESIFLQVANLNRIYVRSVSGTQTVQVIGS
ncbi:MAG: hypothetical protein H8D80_02140 [Proteobacteria bacterium]|nr:hypothetical protein [Pseudomonadota bacterium]